MKHSKDNCSKVRLYSGIITLVSGLVLASLAAHADMMGSMPAAQPQGQSGTTPSDSDMTDIDHDHDKIKADHDQMAKSHKKMVKKDSKAGKGSQHQMMKKMGTMKKKPMPMNNSAPAMMDDDSMGSDKPADTPPSGGMDHM